MRDVETGKKKKTGRQKEERGQDKDRTEHVREMATLRFSYLCRMPVTCFHPQPLGDVALLQRRLGGGGERGNKDSSAPPRDVCSGYRWCKNHPPVG